MSVELTPLDLAGHGLRARVLPYGASLLDLRLDGHPEPLILGMVPEAYPAHPQFYMGAVIGRHANRVANGRASVNGRALDLVINAPPHHSAGGDEGFSRLAWTVERHDATGLVLSLISPDGHEGYPGELHVTATYALLPDACLRLTFEAVSDADTLLTMCHHPYFNFDGSESADAHVLEIAASSYLPCDETVLPSGGPTPVAGSAFDFTTPHRVGTHPGQIYNNTYCISVEPVNPLRHAARLTGQTGVSMDLWTTQSGLHLYNSYKLLDCPHGPGGRRNLPRSAICLEAQNWPDSPNNPDFPSPFLKEGQHYRQVTEYRFSR